MYDYQNLPCLDVCMCVQANSRKRKPRSKKSKTLKPTKTDDVMKSTSSDPPSDKRSDDEDEIEEEKVHLDSTCTVLLAIA